MLNCHSVIVSFCLHIVPPKLSQLRLEIKQCNVGKALILVGASGFSYEEAAHICGCAVGTIKSRVNRARTRLAELMAIDGAEDFGPDQATRAVLVGNDRN